MRIAPDQRLSRLTTIGAGGPAAAFAQPESLAELEEALRWATERDMPVVAVGLGSNLLAADAGIDALVVRLAGDLATVEIDGDLLRAGGGATNAVCLHRARSAGLGGLEFACAIPGTAGGGVRMNAGAYGSDWAGDPPARARRLGGRERLADAGRARPVVPALRARARSGRGTRRVPPFASAHRRDQEATSRTSSRGARRRSRRTSAPSARSSRIHPASSAPAACSRAAD